MKVIICGAGQVGVGIGERLAADDNDVSIVDSSAELVQRVNDMLDVRAIHGNGAHPDILAQAGAGEADMLIAVTAQDEVNMVACQVAHSLFDIPTKIARIRSQTYLDEKWARLFSREHMPIDLIISPEVEVGEMVMRRLALPGAFETVSFGSGAITALGLNCGADCPVIDTPLSQLSDLFPDLPAVVVAIVRNGRLIVPHSDDQMVTGDEAYVITPAEQVARLLQIFGHEELHTRRIVIAGGGNIGFYVAQAIEARETAMRVKVVETSHERAVSIAERLNRTVVLHGNSLSEELLREADTASADTFLALTNDDQANILTAVLAKQLGCERSLCLINSPGYSKLVRTLGIDAQINPRAITVSRILQHVRRGRIRAVHTIQHGAGEIIEAEAMETSPVIGKPLRQLGLSEGIRIGAILRNGKIIIPDGSTELETKDRAILFATNEYIREVEQLFRVSLEYF